MDKENLTPAELLETAERLFAVGDANMYRAAILEAITALEANVRDKAFPSLQAKVGDDLTKWLQEKTRMDFDTRLGLFIPIATGLKVDKRDRIWSDYKKAREIRNRVTHSGRRVTRTQARFVIDTVYEWVEYLNQAQETQQHYDGQDKSSLEKLGRFIQASARLERLIYSAIQKNISSQEQSKKRMYRVEELYHLGLIDESILRELNEFRILRNNAVHAPPDTVISITDAQLKRLIEIVDAIETRLE